MDDAPRAAGSRARDDPSHTYDLSSAVYGMFPSRAPDSPSPTESPIRRSRAGSPAKSLFNNKRRDVVVDLSVKLTAPTSWLSQRLQVHQHQMELHQSTCLNLNMANTDSTESDLWILPDFDDWELENETTQQTTIKREGLLRRAASSNRERLRARLEGDGWDFVGGKYGEEEKAIQFQEALSRGEESVDEEFDVVVLPVLPVLPTVQVSC